MQRKPSQAGDKLFSHAILFIACVAFPAFVTWVAPVSWVTLTRHGDRVEARVNVCLLFVIPFRTDVLSHVRSVDQQVRAGVREKVTSGDANDRRREITTESEGRLVLHGQDEDVVVQVSPANLDEAMRDVREFLEDGTKAELRLFAAANWKASVIAGGALCLLTLLYLFIVLTSLFFRGPARGKEMHSATPDPPCRP